MERIQIKKITDSNKSDSKIYNVCDSCGVKANRLTQQKRLGNEFDIMKFQRKFLVSTYHKGICDVCGRETAVTEPRDFFYPDFSLLERSLNK